MVEINTSVTFQTSGPSVSGRKVVSLARRNFMEAPLFQELLYTELHLFMNNKYR